jgi:transketolase
MTMEIVERPHRTNLVQWAKDKPEVVVLSADLTSSCEADLFRDTYPDRFYSMAMAEQNMIGMAAGMAREGWLPHVHTFAVFLTRRVFDQVAMSVAYPNVKVRLVGFLPGLTTPGGVTHQAIDDVALMRVLPNMTILEVGDATEAETVLDVAHTVDGPVYIRMLRGLVPRLFPAKQAMALGRARVLSAGDDVTLISSGISTQDALVAGSALRRAGVGVQHLHVSTLKPFNDPAVVQAIASARRGVVVVENHTVVSGLGSAVAEVMAEHGAGCRLMRLGLQDVYAHGASLSYLKREYGLDSRAVVSACERLLGESLGIPDDELVDTRVEPVVDQRRTEDL